MRVRNARSLFGMFSVIWLSLSSCSVDELRNVQFTKNCDECEQAGGHCIAGRFCVPDDKQDAGPHDAGTRDAATSGDASTDDDAGTQDAGGDAAKPCTEKEEGKTELCYTAKDQSTARQMPCRAGTRTCRSGFFGECEDEVLPTDEGCNGVDDDCDGRVDEQLTTSECAVEGAQGLCGVGVQFCSHGEPKCVQITGPQSEMCNGDDDDCDGETDEETAIDCYEAGCTQGSDGLYTCVGSCHGGKRECVDREYQDCSGAVSPASTDSCTQVGESTNDEDCDGKFDEGCACSNGISCYTGAADTKSRAPCHAGTQMCTDSTHGTCMDEVTPKAETCANPDVDDDCDGEVDNIPLDGTSCTQRSNGNGLCKAGALWKCVSGEQKCVDAPIAAERCDGRNVDEDCDGKIDEGFNLATDSNNCGACGLTCGAGLRCCAGHCVNTTTSNDHCSTCGNSCTGKTCCNSSCVDRTSDPNNCGTCGNICSGLLKGCTNGVCTKLLL